MGRFVEKTPICPGNGTYSFGQIHGPDMIPPIGELYMDYSLGAVIEHVPTEHSDW